MIEALKPYPEYSYSGLEWLGRLPSHWQVKPCRALFIDVKDRNPGKEPMLSVTIARGVIPQAKQLDGTGKRDSSRIDKSNYKLVCQGDIAYNKMRAWQGALGRSSFRGIVSPAYVVQRPREPLFGLYFHHLARTPAFAKEAERWSYGITSDMWSLRPEHFKLLYSAVPPPDEQAAIVRFLDHANRRIDQFIRSKKKLIALLNEQKLAIIHRAVTRGLDPAVKLKDSGVPWLGEIPVHWRQLALARVSRSRCDGPFGSGLKSEHYQTVGVRVVRLQNIGHGEFRGGPAAFIAPEHYATLGDHSVEPDDVIVAGLGDERHPAGRACVAPSGLGPAMVKADCFRFRLDTGRAQPTFLALQLTATAQGASAILSRGATRERVNLQAMCSRAIALPPLDEQEAVAAAAHWQAQPLTQAIKVNERELDLIREYRTCLISDVVTGQLDVRGAAASLPDIEPEPAPTAPEGDETDIEDVEAA